MLPSIIIIMKYTMHLRNFTLVSVLIDPFLHKVLLHGPALPNMLVHVNSILHGFSAHIM